MSNDQKQQESLKKDNIHPFSANLTNNDNSPKLLLDNSQVRAIIQMLKQTNNDPQSQLQHVAVPIEQPSQFREVPAQGEILNQDLQRLNTQSELNQQSNNCIKQRLRWVIFVFTFISLLQILWFYHFFSTLTESDKNNTNQDEILTIVESKYLQKIELLQANLTQEGVIEQEQMLKDMDRQILDYLAPMQQNILNELKNTLLENPELRSFSRRYLGNNILVNKDSATLINFMGDQRDFRQSVLMIPKLQLNETVSFVLKIALLKNYLNKEVLQMWDVTEVGEWSVAIFICDRIIMEAHEPNYISNQERQIEEGVYEISNEGWFHSNSADERNGLQMDFQIEEKGSVSVTWNGFQQELTLVNKNTQQQFIIQTFFDVNAELYIGVRMFNGHVTIL